MSMEENYRSHAGTTGQWVLSETTELQILLAYVN